MLWVEFRVFEDGISEDGYFEWRIGGGVVGGSCRVDCFIFVRMGRCCVDCVIFTFGRCCLRYIMYIRRWCCFLCRVFRIGEDFILFFLFRVNRLWIWVVGSSIVVFRWRRMMNEVVVFRECVGGGRAG